MCIRDFQEQYSKLNPGEFFIVLFHKTMVMCVYRIDERIILWDSYMHSTDITSGKNKKLDIQWSDSLTPDTVKTVVTDYYGFVGISRVGIIDGVREHIDDPESNIWKIRKDITEDALKLVRFSGNECGILLCATSTDDDYYYTYINEEMKIRQSSCVGKYETLSDGPALEEFAREHFNITSEVTYEDIEQLVYEKLITRLHIWASPEVIVTALPLESALDKYNRQMLKEMHLLAFD